MPKTKKTVDRQCVACRELKEKKSMLRIVRNSDGKIFIDFSGKAAGRGAYICDKPECVAKLKKGKIFDKVFSCRVDEAIYSAIEEEYFGRKG